MVSCRQCGTAVAFKVSTGAGVAGATLSCHPCQSQINLLISKHPQRGWLEFFCLRVAINVARWRTDGVVWTCTSRRWGKLFLTDFQAFICARRHVGEFSKLNLYGTARAACPNSVLETARSRRGCAFCSCVSESESLYMSHGLLLFRSFPTITQ